MRTPSNNYRFTVAYDGTVYSGWQLQPNADSIQQQIETALSKIVGAPVRVHGSGRTDAGVHARAQVAHATFTTRHSPITLRRALKRELTG